MVPLQEPTKYLYEIRAFVECVVKKFCETSEVLPPTPTQHEANVHGFEVEASNDTNVGNTSNTDVVMDVQPSI